MTNIGANPPWLLISLDNRTIHNVATGSDPCKFYLFLLDLSILVTSKSGSKVELSDAKDYTKDRDTLEKMVFLGNILGNTMRIYRNHL